MSTYLATLADALDRLGYRPAWLLASPPGETPSPISPARRLFRAATGMSFVRPLTTIDAVGSQAWILQDLYRIAYVYFNLYRRALAVRVSSPPALMHWSYPLPLHMVGVPQILTVHDLIPLESPDLSGIRAARHERVIRSILPNMARVVTVSGTVRDALIQRYGLPPERVVNTGQPVDLSPALLCEADALRDAPVPSNGFLVVGTVERRKNTGRIIRAHALSGTTRPLSIVGPDGDGVVDELSALAEHPFPERVHRLPWLPRPVLVRAIRDARALLFPSLAEGFGLPIAEAMTLGTPVLTSLGGATEEIAGGSALLVEPHDVVAIANGIVRLDRDDTLHAVLRLAGLERADAFAPEAYAARLDALYRSVLDAPNGLPAPSRIA